ncbi:Chromo domain-containing protein [Mycena indigotica]|uniref:Chromo domain-containing protein n=1 Tax=Mycena indigotica TaxID=2126181 RepID=A0A8H6T0G3_9AGAR|nr:Chromo domain-containing protein [Mycena indigotica]KAF7309418.1 Chromo domain-containing protein [Mycena indigotica]
MGKRKRHHAEPKRWYVEVILKAKRQFNSSGDIRMYEVRLGGWIYFVKWAGWSDDDNTWEPIENLLSCLSKIHRFWQLGVDQGSRTFMTNENGVIVSPLDGYIEAEKKIFAKEVPQAEVDAQNANPRRARTEWVTDSLSPSRSPSPNVDEEDVDVEAAPAKKARIATPLEAEKQPKLILRIPAMKHRQMGGDEGMVHPSQSAPQVEQLELTTPVPKDGNSAPEPKPEANMDDKESGGEVKKTWNRRQIKVKLWDGPQALESIGNPTKKRLAQQKIAPNIPHYPDKASKARRATDVEENQETSAPADVRRETTPTGNNYVGEGTLEFGSTIPEMVASDAITTSFYDAGEDPLAALRVNHDHHLANEDLNIDITMLLTSIEQQAWTDLGVDMQ